MYPALTVLQALLEGTEGAHAGVTLSEVIWVGSRGGIEQAMVDRAGVQFIGLAAGGLRGMGLWTQVRNAARIAGSVVAARRLLARFRPDAVLMTGGYACVAVTLAARWLRIPVMIYLPDIEPGIAIRAMSGLATRIAVTSEESTRYLPRDKVVVTGYPVRPEISTIGREQARRKLDLEAELPVLLVFGGSRGARSINTALLAGLGELLPWCQVVHVSGKLDAEVVAAAPALWALPEELRRRYHLHAYLHEMPAALAAADLAVARAGAATLGEFPAAGLPAILVPYPYSGRHQQRNAQFMQQHGAAVELADARLGEELVPKARELLQDRSTLLRMRQAAQALAQPQAAQTIARQLRLMAAPARPKETGVQP